MLTNLGIATTKLQVIEVTGRALGCYMGSQCGLRVPLEVPYSVYIGDPPCLRKSGLLEQLLGHSPFAMTVSTMGNTRYKPYTLQLIQFKDNFLEEEQPKA